MDFATIGLSLDILSFNNRSIKEGTLKTYRQNLTKLYNEIYLKKGELELLNNIPISLNDPLFVIGMLDGDSWGLSLRTKKNYLSVIMSLVRNDGDYKDAYLVYTDRFNELKVAINKVEIEQKPLEKEECLEGITIRLLEKGLNFHIKKTKGADNKDKESALKVVLGHIHISEVLRNEPCNMILTDEYLSQEEFPKTNFIWDKNLKTKLMVIRDNKVRNADKGDIAKEVVLNKQCNTAINKLIQIYKRNDILLPTRLCGDISNSTYTQLIKTIWGEQLGLELTSTLIRKVYAKEVNVKNNGKITEELKACDKLDHTLGTHTKNYILHF
tara:strand:- start:2174 stop:3154 length:981 start_codon:yes stop_codon:yes gene_type:complete